MATRNNNRVCIPTPRFRRSTTIVLEILFIISTCCNISTHGALFPLRSGRPILPKASSVSSSSSVTKGDQWHHLHTNANNEPRNSCGPLDSVYPYPPSSTIQTQQRTEKAKSPPPLRTKQPILQQTSTFLITALLPLVILASPLPSSIASATSSDNPDVYHRVSLLQKLRDQQHMSPSQIADTEAFQRLRRLQEQPLSRGMKEKRDLENLQDDRLKLCEERGVFWEQCFMFGSGGVSAGDSSDTGSISKMIRDEDDSSNIENGNDYQIISPMGALEPNSSGSGLGTTQKIPTW